jgi:hypothetical protein
MSSSKFANAVNTQKSQHEKRIIAISQYAMQLLKEKPTTNTIVVECSYPMRKQVFGCIKCGAVMQGTAFMSKCLHCHRDIIKSISYKEFEEK